jgi:hypothetical protein
MEHGIISNDMIKNVCFCIFGVSCLTGIVLLILGFASLEAVEYGLDYSWISKTVFF